jgi:hypothetical protein
MQIISPGVFRAQDKETITIDTKATGTLSLINASIYGGTKVPVTTGKPIVIKLDKSKANHGSFVPNAKSTDLTLLFSFSGDNGGRYDLTTTGDPGGDSFPDFVDQAGNTPETTTYTFHIV